MGRLEGFACVVKAPLPKTPTMDRVNARVMLNGGSKQLGLRGETAWSQATSVTFYSTFEVTESKYETEYQGYFFK